jgi:RNA polymerase sigma-70 factor (ECF subfamily)
MPESSLRTVQLQGWLDRIRAGDREAREELIRATCGRLERLARRMLGGFANLRPMAETGDVLNGALMRLMDSLHKIDPLPASGREFFNLAACHIRRELLDLARHYGRARRRGDVSAVPLRPGRSSDGGAEPADPADEPDTLERWGRFHEAVERLPAEEREVVGLKFYHGWTEAQIAELFGVDVRTVRRRWRAAFLALSAALAERPAGP